MASSLFGTFASYEFPVPIQNSINFLYVKLLGVDMSEFEPYQSFRSLNKLFTRELKTPREIEESSSSVISPCDSLITHIGKVSDSFVCQIKGVSYSLEELLGDFYAYEVESLEGGDYINFYLSPKDYHRYHMPIDVTVESLVHIPGRLHPVNIPFLKRNRNLFIENERVVIALRDRFERRHFLVLIGALNVGKIVVEFERRVRTNTEIMRVQHYRYENSISMKKGQLLGWFEMGSSIVLIAQKGSVEYDVEINSKVKFGERIGELI
jgi:phosphatidylserine decarboxylase